MSGIPGLALLALLAAGPDPNPDPSALIARLGSGRYAEREAAAEALETLGRDALAPLIAARRDPDAEIQARAEALLGRIESRLLTRPTTVRLDGRERPLAEVVRSIAEQAGFSLALDDDEASARRRITLRDERPMTFWEALDRLGLVALWGSREVSIFGSRESGPPPLRLAPRPRSAYRVSDRGPFRVVLRGDPKSMGPGLRAEFIVLAEPRLMLRPVGPLRLTEAVDGEGATLVPQTGRPGTMTTMPAEDTVSPFFSAEAYLLAPRSAKSIKRLRGTVPVEVSARKLEPTTVPLSPPERAVGRSFPGGDYTMILQAIRDDRPRPELTIELALLPRDAPVVQLMMRRGRGRGFGGGFGGFGGPGMDIRQSGVLDRMVSQLEVLDGHGRRREWIRVHSNFQGQLIYLTFDTTDPERAPAEIRFHDYARTTTDVEFEFDNVPLP
jgi:hypothetical protein